MAAKLSSRVSSIASMATSASNAIKQKISMKDDIPFLERQIYSCPSWSTVKKKVKYYSKKWFTHVGLVTILLGYLVLGAYIFMTLEREYEDRMKEEIASFKLALIDELWTKKDGITVQAEWRTTIQSLLDRYEDKLRQAAMLGLKSNSEPQWTPMGSIFFSATVITTIGYGHITPSTAWGRIACMFYAICGIPMFLVVLVDLGKLFTRAIKFVWSFIRRFYYTGTCRRYRMRVQQQTRIVKEQAKKSADYAKDYASYYGRKGADLAKEQTRIAIERGVLLSRDAVEKVKSRGKGDASSDSELELDVLAAPAAKLSRPTSISEMEKSLDYRRPTKRAAMARFDDLDDPDLEEPEIMPEFVVDEEFNLPITIALALLTGYIFVGGVIFCIAENWGYLQAFYFCFVSLSTIGFGDVVPMNEYFMLMALAYIFMGLALTSMVINVVMEFFSSKVVNATERLKEKLKLNTEDMSLASSLSDSRKDLDGDERCTVIDIPEEDASPMSVVEEEENAESSGRISPDEMSSVALTGPSAKGAAVHDERTLAVDIEPSNVGDGGSESAGESSPLVKEPPTGSAPTDAASATESPTSTPKATLVSEDALDRGDSSSKQVDKPAAMSSLFKPFKPSLGPREHIFSAPVKASKEDTPIPTSKDSSLDSTIPTSIDDKGDSPVLTVKGDTRVSPVLTKKDGQGQSPVRVSKDKTRNSPVVTVKRDVSDSPVSTSIDDKKRVSPMLAGTPVEAVESAPNTAKQPSTTAQRDTKVPLTSTSSNPVLPECGSDQSVSPATGTDNSTSPVAIRDKDLPLAKNGDKSSVSIAKRDKPALYAAKTDTPAKPVTKCEPMPAAERSDGPVSQTGKSNKPMSRVGKSDKAVSQAGTSDKLASPAEKSDKPKVKLVPIVKCETPKIPSAAMQEEPENTVTFTLPIPIKKRPAKTTAVKALPGAPDKSDAEGPSSAQRNASARDKPVGKASDPSSAEHKPNDKTSSGPPAGKSRETTQPQPAGLNRGKNVARPRAETSADAESDDSDEPVTWSFRPKVKQQPASVKDATEAGSPAQSSSTPSKSNMPLFKSFTPTLGPREHIFANKPPPGNETKVTNSPKPSTKRSPQSSRNLSSMAAKPTDQQVTIENEVNASKQKTSPSSTAKSQNATIIGKNVKGAANV